MLSGNECSKFDLVHQGVSIVRLVFGATFFMKEPLRTIGSEVIAAQDLFFALVGRDAVTQYATTTMGKHKPITARALGTPKAWFKPTAPKSEHYGIEYTNADPFNAAPSLSFEFTGWEPTDAGRLEVASTVRFTVPADWLPSRLPDLMHLIDSLCKALPFRSGSAGYAFQSSRYFREKALTHAWVQSLRHPGIDIYDLPTDAGTVGFGGIRGVNWLTLLDEQFVKDLGGIPNLPGCKISNAGTGILIQAGDAPAIGDVNRKDDLPPYRNVFQYVRPVARRMADARPLLPLVGDDGNGTRRWLNRFGDG